MKHPLRRTYVCGRDKLPAAGFARAVRFGSLLAIAPLLLAADFYQVSHNTTQTILEHDQCRRVTNDHASGRALFVPTRTSTEWASFYNNTPIGVTAAACNHGYFVVTSSTTNGVIGGEAGANAFCLNDLTTNNWKGKAEANNRGLLVAAKVKAFLCTGAACMHGIPDTQYMFASARNVSHGGGSFVTNTSGIGPNDSANWSSATHFGDTSLTFWTGRANGTVTTWGGSNNNRCANFNGGGDGRAGVANSTTHTRWAVGSVNCAQIRSIICMVNP